RDEEGENEHDAVRARRHRVPALVRRPVGGDERERTEHEQHENRDRREALQQPGTLPGEDPHRSPHASSATSTATMPAAIDTSALARAWDSRTPTPMSISRCRTPAKTWCTSAQTPTKSSGVNHERVADSSTASKPCGLRSDSPSALASSGSATTSTTPQTRCRIDA